MYAWQGWTTISPSKKLFGVKLTGWPPICAGGSPNKLC